MHPAGRPLCELVVRLQSSCGASRCGSAPAAIATAAAARQSVALATALPSGQAAASVWYPIG